MPTTTFLQVKIKMLVMSDIKKRKHGRGDDPNFEFKNVGEDLNQDNKLSAPKLMHLL